MNAVEKEGKTCAGCGVHFEPKHPSGRYCTKSCAAVTVLPTYWTARRLEKMRKCPQCGKLFVPKEKAALRCSRACYNATRRARMRRICVRCGKEFYRKKGRYCSPDCSNQGRSELDAAVDAEYASASGWPAHLPNKQTQILNVLAAAGVPLTVYELVRLTATRSREYVNISLSRLASCGLVVKIRRWQKSRNWRCGYTIGPAGLALLEERAKCESAK